MDCRRSPFRPRSVPALWALTASCAVALVLLAGGCATTSGGGQTPPSTSRADSTGEEVPATIAVSPAARRQNTARLDTVEAGRFDEGRMWTFEDPPLDYFEEEYDFRPDEDWFRRARLGALRLPNCTASFVSPHGLVLTNHHCGRDFAASTAREGENILQDGFYAASRADERPVEGLYADQLVAIENVTGEVEDALDGAQTEAERADARERVFEEIRQRRSRRVGSEQGAGEAAAGALHTQVVSLYNGGRYSAYTFRRYEDLRLVMIPEAAVGYFGGDPDNFTYPRYTYDVSFFRVYDDGRPLEPDVFFPFDPDGSEAREPVFVVGNPGSTSRLEAVSQLAFRRDVSDRALLATLEARREAFVAFAGKNPSEAMENKIFSLGNAIKLYRGRLRALRDPYIQARRRDAEENFQEAIEADPALRDEYGGLIADMDQVQQQKREDADAYRAFLLLSNPTFSSATLRRALLARRYLARQQAGAPAEQQADLREQLLNVEDQPAGLDRRLLEVQLSALRQHLSDATARAVLGGRTPSAAARAMVRQSALRSAGATREALESGSLSMDDPALDAVSAFYESYRDFRSAQSGLRARQAEVARRLGQARYAAYGTDVPPDATFSLRIADGRVKGYEYNGTVAPPYTTFYGLYNHYYSYGDGTPWDLPARWLRRRDALDLSTPLDLVSTNDITGGNSGSPLLNRDLELVGIAFDGNIESLAGDFIYLPERARAVSVDARGILEGLDSVYQADRLVRELRRAETEAASQ